MAAVTRLLVVLLPVLGTSSFVPLAPYRRRCTGSKLPARSRFKLPIKLRRSASCIQSSSANAEPSPKFWQAWRVHDAFNLAVLPAVTMWTSAALFKSAWNTPLAIFFAAYVLVDALWIALQPDIVSAPQPLIGHHLVTLLLLWHPITYMPHRHFVSWMTTVELNTVFLILRRHVTHPLLDMGFKLSWVAIRVLWFPFLAIYFSFFVSNWPVGWLGAVRHAVVAGCTSGLALLQLQWTWNAVLKSKEKSSATEEKKAGEKKGFL